MHTGTVKFFNQAKKFGFITDDADQKEYFVHAQGCLTPISDKDKVQFELIPDKRGLKAVNVQKL